MSGQLIKSCDLFSTTALSASIQNIISRCKESFDIRYLENIIELSIRDDGAHPSPLKIGIAIDNQLGELHIPADFINIFIKNNLSINSYVDISLAQALHLEYGLSHLIEELEVLFSKKISLLPRQNISFQEESYKITFCASLQQDKEFIINLYLPNSEAKSILSIYKNFVPKATNQLDNLPIPISLTSGYQDITLTEILSLKTGDAVILKNQELVLISNSLIASTQHNLKSSCLLETPHTFFSGDIYMPSNDNHKDIDTTNSTSIEDIGNNNIDNMPVRIVCEIGRLQLPLKEVRLLKSGSIIPLSRPLESSVDILANGQRIGRGSLIKIDDVMGLRIDNINLGD